MSVADQAEMLLGLGSAILHEAAGRRGALGPTIRPLWAGARVAGPCRTVRLRAGDNLGAHLAVEGATPGDVLCVGIVGATAHGPWGEVLTVAAMTQGIIGLVTGGCVRDADAIHEHAFPVFAAGHSIQGTGKRHPGDHQLPVRIGQALIRPGDWIVADADGAVALRPAELEAVVAAAHAKVEAEAGALEQIRAGRSSREALGIAVPRTTGRRDTG